MRSLRWVLLAALLFSAAAVLGTYNSQRRAVRAQRRPLPPPVALDTKTAATEWEWGQSGNGQPQVYLKAKNMTQSADGEKAELQDIELRIYQKDGKHYDRVVTANAEFNTSTNKLFSPGAAKITLNVPVAGDPPHQLTSITTSRINFDSKSGQAESDQHVAFTFEEGDGTATGATYDPNSRTLHLLNDVVLNLNGDGPQSKPMRVESAQLAWNESNSLLNLSPWARLTRDQTAVEAGPAVIQLKDKKIAWIDAPQVHGVDSEPGRKLEYSADRVHVDYNSEGKIEKLAAAGHARLIAHADQSQTTMSGDRVDLFLADDNTLTSAVASGSAYLESKPNPDPDGATGDTRILRADALHLQMRPGGKELERVNTQSPGTLEFLPSQPARHRRVLKAEAMVIDYGQRNQIRAFHAAAGGQGVFTETFPSELEKQKKGARPQIALTSSKAVDATFDEHSQLRDMRQSENFRYSQGDRKAQAVSATLDNEKNVMNLESGARIEDESGITTADRIRIDQASGDFEASGHAYTTRQPESSKSESAMLDDSEPMHGSADRVVSASHNHLVRYAGNAIVWQTANRIQADRIDIDRDKKTVAADGHVVTQLLDQPKKNGEDPLPQPAPATSAPVFTIVKAQHMVYTDADRLATYTGGVDFWRPSMSVKGATLEAYLNDRDSGKDSRLDRAMCDGNAEILQVTADRRRLGASEHVEYYQDEGKVVLSGGSPQLDDSVRGNTKGDELTYFTNDNRLLVNGAPKSPVRSQLRKKKKS